MVNGTIERKDNCINFKGRVEIDDYTESTTYEEALMSIYDNKVIVKPIYFTKFYLGEQVVNYIGTLGRIIEIVSAKRGLYKVQWIYGQVVNCCEYDIFKIKWNKEGK